MDAKTQAMLNALASQRNQALDALVQVQAEVAERDQKIAALQAELQAAKPQA